MPSIADNYSYSIIYYRDGGKTGSNELIDIGATLGLIKYVKKKRRRKLL